MACKHATPFFCSKLAASQLLSASFLRSQDQGQPTGPACSLHLWSTTPPWLCIVHRPPYTSSRGRDIQVVFRVLKGPDLKQRWRVSRRIAKPMAIPMIEGNTFPNSMHPKMYLPFSNELPPHHCPIFADQTPSPAASGSPTPSVSWDRAAAGAVAGPRSSPGRFIEREREKKKRHVFSQVLTNNIAQGGCGSFKDSKRIGEVDCCSCM